MKNHVFKSLQKSEKNSKNTKIAISHLEVDEFPECLNSLGRFEELMNTAIFCENQHGAK